MAALTGEWATWNKYLSRYKKQEEVKVIEVGVFVGGATCWFLENVLSGPKSYIVAIDTFEGSPEYKSSLNFKSVEEEFQNNIKKTKREDKVKKMKMYSREALVKLNQSKSNIENFDIIFIDASHEGADVISDAVLAWTLLKPGGVMIFDDYIWGKLNKKYFTPKPAIDSFIYLYTPYLDVIHPGRQMFVQKRSPDKYEKPLISINVLFDRFNDLGYKKLFKTIDSSAIKPIKPEKIIPLKLTNDVDLYKLLKLGADDPDVNSLIMKKFSRILNSDKEFKNMFYMNKFIKKYASTYEVFSFFDTSGIKNIRLLNTTFVRTENTGNTLNKLNNFHGKIDYILHLKNANWGKRQFEPDVNLHSPEGSYDFIQIRTYNSKQIKTFIKIVKNTFHIIKLNNFCRHEAKVLDQYKYCHATMFANLVFGISIQEKGGSLLLTGIMLHPNDEKVINILSIGAMYYEKVKFIWTPINITSYNILFSGFKEIHRDDLEKLFYQLDRCEIDDLDASNVPVDNVLSKIDARLSKLSYGDKKNKVIIEMYNHLYKHINTTVSKYVENINEITKLRKSYEGNKKMLEILEYGINKQQLQRYLIWQTLKFKKE